MAQKFAIPPVQIDKKNYQLNHLGGIKLRFPQVKFTTHESPLMLMEIFHTYCNLKLPFIVTCLFIFNIIYNLLPPTHTFSDSD